jgi:putative acetyltransferase
MGIQRNYSAKRQWVKYGMDNKWGSEFQYAMLKNTRKNYIMMDSSLIKTVRTDSGNPDFAALIKFLDNYLNECYGEKQGFFNQFNKLDAIKNVVIAYSNGIAVGCGAFKKYSDHRIEVKRMFVRQEYRRKGIAEKILQELEAWASELGFIEAILETGKGQPESQALYQKIGFSVTENYGQYIGVEISVCMRKQLF